MWCGISVYISPKTTANGAEEIEKESHGQACITCLRVKKRYESKEE